MRCSEKPLEVYVQPMPVTTHTPKIVLSAVMEIPLMHYNYDA